MQKEAKARIKINTLLEEAGWRFLPSDEGRATVMVEGNVKLDALGDDFASNRRLIELFEAKMRHRIKKVWGE